MKFEESQKWLERAKKVIPYPYNQTFSKSYDQYVQGVSPVFASAGDGPNLWDVDGNKYIDLTMGLMPVILGYDALGKGASHESPIASLPHPSEVELSELLCEIIPCAEMVRLGKNGSDVTTAAVRLARAITGKDIVLQCGYHGWHDWSIGNSWRSKGVPVRVSNLTVPFKYNDFEMFQSLIRDRENMIACVIMEPVQFQSPEIRTDFMIEYNNFLEYVRFLCSRNNILLIFDEMITGFRFALGGAQEFFNVIPDLACFGKAMANGWPISAVVGKREYMEEFKDVHFSTTFGGEIHSISAAIKTINFIRDNDVVPYLWGAGKWLNNRLINSISKYCLSDYLNIEGYPVRFQLVAKDNIVKSFISRQLIKKGILWIGPFNLSYAHKQEHLDKIIEAFDEVFSSLSKIFALGERLEDHILGEPIRKRESVRSW